jgi:hypothetical protein
MTGQVGMGLSAPFFIFDMETKDIFEGQQTIVDRAPCKIEVCGKTYKVKQISNTVRRRISMLEKKAYLLEEEGKQGVSLKRAKRIDTGIRTLHSKTAAYYLMNNTAVFFPFLWWLRWHILDLRSSEVTYRINEAGANNVGMDFFLANWQITKAQLALSTKLVGEGIKQYQERLESAAGMLAEDASGIKRDNK